MEKTKKIRGTNLGNWLVLEKWMQPQIFEGTGCEDEVWLNRKMDHDELSAVLKKHRDTYVTEEDFENIAAHGMNMVRIPVPYFIFGDRPPFDGCIEYLDRAFDWAEKYDLQILIDLHTVPGSQNGYDNGGICGVCKWCKDPEEVEFALSVLERLSRRYSDRKGLFGIEVLNEPISFSVWMTSPTRTKAADKEEAKGSGHVPMKFLKQFYKDAYTRIRKYLPADKCIVFHDGFRLGRWKDFFVRSGMENVILDTHIYIQAMEGFVPFHAFWVYRLYIGFNEWLIRRAQRYTPVVVGEWCVSNKAAGKMKRTVMRSEEYEAERRRKYQEVAGLQIRTWEKGAGYFYWNYQLYRDHKADMGEAWLDSWDLCRCWKNKWMPDHV